MSPVLPAMKTNRRVLGVDPGLGRLGWAILEQCSGEPKLIGCGCLETSARAEDPQRLQTLYRRLHDIITEYRPELVVVEKLYFTKNVTTGIAVGQARGVVLLSAAEATLPVLELTPTAVKQNVTGDGRADKRQLAKMVQLLLKLDRLPKHDDTTDAMAIALCGLTVKMLH